MMEGLTGRFARSGAGHDAGTVYLIVREEERQVYLCDGRLHPLDKPKKKNLKHVKLTDVFLEGDFLERLRKNEKIFDHEIRYAIKTIAGKEETHVKE